MLKRKRDPTAFVLVTAVIIAVLMLLAAIYIQVTREISRDTWMKSAVVVISNGRATGNGIIISEDGYILTLHHVSEMSNPSVYLYSDRQEVHENRFHTEVSTVGLLTEGIEVELVESWPKYDLSLMKIDPEGRNLTVASFADVSVGDPITVVGSPLGLTWSVTSGTVSAIRFEPSGVRWIETDAVMNQGSSGGPVYDKQGRVVGIVRIGLGLPTRYGIRVPLGFSFAIDALLAQKFAEGLMEIDRHLRRTR